MPPLVWIGSGLAAIVAAAWIMLRGGMIERPARREEELGPAGAGSPSGEGIPELGEEEEDPFKRYPRPKRGAGSQGGPGDVFGFDGEYGGGELAEQGGYAYVGFFDAPAPTQTETSILQSPTLKKYGGGGTTTLSPYYSPPPPQTLISSYSPPPPQTIVAPNLPRWTPPPAPVYEPLQTAPGGTGGRIVL